MYILSARMQIVLALKGALEIKALCQTQAGTGILGCYSASSHSSNQVAYGKIQHIYGPYDPTL